MFYESEFIGRGHMPKVIWMSVSLGFTKLEQSLAPESSHIQN